MDEVTKEVRLVFSLRFCSWRATKRHAVGMEREREKGPVDKMFICLFG